MRTNVFIFAVALIVAAILGYFSWHYWNSSTFDASVNDWWHILFGKLADWWDAR